MAYFAPELTLIGSASGVVMGKDTTIPTTYDRFEPPKDCGLPNDTCPDQVASSSEW